MVHNHSALVPRCSFVVGRSTWAYGRIAQHTERSVTELEIIHGMLANPSMGGHAYFPDHKRSADIPEAVRHGVFAETDPAIIAKLAEIN